MDSLISTFHIDWHLIVAQAINFVVVLLVLYFFALKPLKKLMEERGATIEGGLENAKLHEKLLVEAKIEIEKNQIEFQKGLNEQKKLFKADLNKLGDEHSAKMKEDDVVWLANRAKQLEADKGILLESVKNEVGNLIILSVEKIVNDTMTEKIDKKIVEDTIKDLWK